MTKSTILFDKPGELYVVKRGFALWSKKHVSGVDISDLNIYKDCDIFLKKDDVIMFLGIRENKFHFLHNNKIAVDLTCEQCDVYVMLVKKI